MKKKRRHKKRVYVCYYCLFMRMRRGYDSSPFFPLLQVDEYKICSTGPVSFFSSSCSFYHLFSSTVFSLSLSLFLLFNTWCRFGIRRNIIIILLLSLHHSYLFFPNSRDATIIVCPIYFFAIFIFLKERSHLVFRLLYN